MLVAHKTEAMQLREICRATAFKWQYVSKRAQFMAHPLSSTTDIITVTVHGLLHSWLAASFKGCIHISVSQPITTASVSQMWNKMVFWDVEMRSWNVDVPNYFMPPLTLLSPSAAEYKIGTFCTCEPPICLIDWNTNICCWATHCFLSCLLFYKCVEQSTWR